MRRKRGLSVDVLEKQRSELEEQIKRLAERQEKLSARAVKREMRVLNGLCKDCGRKRCGLYSSLCCGCAYQNKERQTTYNDRRTRKPDSNAQVA